MNLKFPEIWILEQQNSLRITEHHQFRYTRKKNCDFHSLGDRDRYLSIHLIHTCYLLLSYKIDFSYK